MKSLYAEDLLNLVEGEEYNKYLTETIEKMYNTGGFYLTKFSSYNESVLITIPESHGIKRVKYSDLVNEELPTEMVLGTYWSLSKDQLCFKLNLKAENITRRGMPSTLR